MSWPDAVDEILGGDQAVALAYVTPARGVVLVPLTNTGLREPASGRLTPVTSSVGMWRKLARIQEEPRVAIAYHTRTHGFSPRPEYVLVQGRAALGDVEDRGWIDRHRTAWERFAGPRDVGPWEPFMRAYHWRVPVELEAKRILVWPDLACRGVPEVHGAPPPDPPPPQPPPRKGTAPRLDPRRAARRASRLADVLLGWVGGDGHPVVVAVGVRGADDRGILLSVPAGTLPGGGRRAGLIAHAFGPHSFGQHQRRHSGWLEVESGEAVFAPHTESGYRLPAVRPLYRAAAAYATTRGLRDARRAGFAPR